MEDDVGRHAARARDLQAQRAQPLEQIAIDALPRLGLDARRASAGGPSPAASGAPATGPARRAGVLQQRDARRRSAAAPDTRRRSAAAVRARAADRCSRAPRRSCASFSSPKMRQLVVAARAHLLAVAAAQHVGDVRGAEALADARDARQDLARQRDRHPATASSSPRQ